MRPSLIVCMFVLSLTVVDSVHPQCSKGGLARSIVFSADRTRIDFALDHEVAQTPNPESLAWLVFDLDSKSQVEITSVKMDTGSTGVIALKEPLKKGDTYVLSVSGLKFKNCTETISPNFVRITNSTVSGVKAFPATAASSRDSADIYLAGLIDGAQGAKASYTADVKLQLPVIFADKFWKFEDVSYLPSFDFKASTNPKSDGNSVTIGQGIRMLMPLVGDNQPSALFRDWLPYFGYAIESDKQFTDVNNTFRWLNYFNMHTYGTRLQFAFRPMVGVETGGNGRAPQGGLYPGAILRPTAGIHVFLNLFTSKDWKRTAFVESDYVRRWPMFGEPNSIVDSTGKVQITSVGTNPRDYVSNKFEYDFNQYFGVTFQHDYGQLPPLFTKVQNKYTVGFVFKTGLQYKPK